MRKSPFLHFCTYVTYLLSAVHAFNVTVGNPTQCDDLAVSWDGGQAPYEILVTPFNQPLRNILVPPSAFSNGKGSYSIPQFPFKAGTQFLLTMSDATAFGSGGTTTILNVGVPVANNKCNITIPSQDFYFSTPSTIQQCNEYDFTYYDDAVLPATITGLIPGGEPIVLHPVTTPSYTWVSNVQEGTDLLFFMTDSQGRQGGVDNLKKVANSDNVSCLGVNSPSSTVFPPSQKSSQSILSTIKLGSHTSTVGIITGAAGGVVVLLVLFMIVSVRCKRKASRSSDVMSPPQRQSRLLKRKNDGREVIQQTDRVSHSLPIQPASQSRLSNASPTDPIRQHIRQISHADSFGRGSSISSASRRMPAMDGQMSPNSPHRTLPVGLAPPVHPGTHSHLTDTFSSNDPHAPFNQMRPSRLSSNTDTFATRSFVPPPGRRMATTAGQAALLYPSPYQTRPVSHPPPPIQPRGPLHYRSASSFTFSDDRSSLARASRLGSNMDGIARYTIAASPSQSSSSRQTVAMAVQAALSNPFPLPDTLPDTLPNPLPNPFPDQTAPVHFAPSNRPGILAHNASFGSFTVNDGASPLNPTQSSRLSSTMDGFTRDIGAGSSSSASQPATNPPAQIVKHIDMEDVVAASGSQDVIEFPPEYVQRQLIYSETATTPDLKISQSHAHVL